MKLLRWQFSLVSILVFFSAVFISCSDLKQVELKKVESITIVNSSSEGIDMEVQLVMSNPNFMKVTITGGDLNLVLNKIDMGKVELKNHVALPAHSEISQKFLIHVGVSNALLGGFASLLSLFKNNNATVVLRGTINARSFGISHSFPVEQTTRIPFSF